MATSGARSSRSRKAALITAPARAGEPARVNARTRTAASARDHLPTFTRNAVAALFLERQHLDRPRARRLTATSLERFVTDVGGLQLDSINVVERAHYLTAWSRFGVFPRTALDRLAWRRRVLFEYWAHAACMVPRAQLPAWRRAMIDYEFRHTGWSGWLKKNARVLETVESEIRARGPMANAEFREKRPAGASGWWNWKPATHGLHYLWMTGRIMVHSRAHFHKHFDLAARVLAEFDAVEPLSSEAFARWHMVRSLHAMGAATETDLNGYLTFPRTKATVRRRTLQAMVANGEVVEIAVAGDRNRWFALPEDLGALHVAGRRRAPSRGTTFLAPFDSLMWYRERVKRLFGFDYRIEVYTPSHRRVHGYYALPIFHDGQLIGRADVKTHRVEKRLEVKWVHFEPWFVAGEKPPAANWGVIDPDRALAGVGAALGSLAEFVGAEAIDLGRVGPANFKRPLNVALATRPEPATPAPGTPAPATP